MSSPTQPIKYPSHEHRALAQDEYRLRTILWAAQKLQREIDYAIKAVESATAHDALAGLRDSISLADIKSAIEGEVS